MNIKVDHSLGSIDLFKLYIKHYTLSAEEEKAHKLRSMYADKKKSGNSVDNTYAIKHYFADVCKNAIIILDIVTVYVNSLKGKQPMKVLAMLEVLKQSLIGSPFQVGS